MVLWQQISNFHQKEDLPFYWNTKSSIYNQFNYISFYQQVWLDLNSLIWFGFFSGFFLVLVLTILFGILHIILNWIIIETGGVEIFFIMLISLTWMVLLHAFAINVEFVCSQMSSDLTWYRWTVMVKITHKRTILSVQDIMLHKVMLIDYVWTQWQRTGTPNVHFVKVAII